jgi:two-component system cell cycle response regulator CtrA
MRILQVEDDSATAQSVELMLKSEGFNVYTTDLGEEAIDLAKIYDHDLILLDLNLPDISGFEVLKAVRQAKICTPIMILSGNTSIDAKVKAFGAGADDFMTKPFHKDELVCRIHAIIRRSKGHAQSVIKTGHIVVNLDAKTVEIVDRRLHLTGKEYQMLELLSLRKGITLTKEMFLNHLYGGMDEPELKIIDVFICKLRKKLARINNGHHHIETVWGRGYVLRDPPIEEVSFANEDDPVLEPEPVAVNQPETVSAEALAVEGRYVTTKEKVARAMLGQGSMRIKYIFAKVRESIDPDITYISVMNGIRCLQKQDCLISEGEPRFFTHKLTEKGVQWLAQIDEADGKSLAA